MLAYLVIREGTKWTDVFRLVPGQSVTIGRAPTNQIILNDDRCSRTHAEVFTSQGKWILRDLDSRNGTVIANELVRGDRVLEAGDIVRIGHPFENQDDLGSSGNVSRRALRRPLRQRKAPAMQIETCD